RGDRRALGDRRARLRPARRARERAVSARQIAPAVFRIHRYPAALIDRVRLADGRSVLVRPVLPQDSALQQDFVRGLSAANRYRRCHSALRELPESTLDYLTQVDYASHLALLAETFEDDGCGVQVAEARYVLREDADDVAERAAAAADGWHGRGLATYVLRAVAAGAAASGLRRLEGSVLADNAPMRALVRSLGWRIGADPADARLVVASVSLNAAEVASC